MIIIVTTLYNAEKYIGKCIDSIKSQTYENFKCYITDDLSTDGSIQVAKQTIDKDNRFILLKNNCKAYQPGNYDYVIRNNKDIDDNDVIVELDGDDWFPDSNVLERVDRVYQDDDVWIANGSFIYSNGQRGFATKQQIDSNLRSTRMTCSHLRTWRAGLWRKIKQQDLKNEHGIYWPVTGDLAFMFPMLEMSGQKHYRFMKDVNYVYNGDNPLNDHKVDLPLVNEVAQTIRAMKSYDRVDTIKRSKVGLVVIATKHYISFLDKLLTTADQYFLPNENVEYFIFTDHEKIDVKTKRKINIIKIDHKPWPWMTLGRYEIFSTHSDQLADLDYIFYSDVDMRFDDVVDKEILSDRVATQHPGFYNRRGTPETNPASLACVYHNEQMQYFAGGFNGGTRSEFLKMSKKLSHNIRIDHDKNIIAVWHDESHMNRYFIDNPPTKILDPGYCWAECHKPPFHPKIIALDKDHKSIRA